VIDSGPLAPWYKNMMSSTIPLEEDRAVAMGNTHKKIWWSLVVWFSSYASRQTDRQTKKQQTDILINTMHLAQGWR